MDEKTAKRLLKAARKVVDNVADADVLFDPGPDERQKHAAASRALDELACAVYKAEGREGF